MAKTKNEVIAILKSYLNDVDKICHVDKAFLFGSYAHGRPGKNSDIDVAIFSRSVTDQTRLQVMSKVIMLINKLKLDIQPVVFSYKDYFMEDNEFISCEIKKKGIEIPL